MPTIKEIIQAEGFTPVKPLSSYKTILEKSVYPIFEDIKNSLNHTEFFHNYIANDKSNELYSLFNKAFHLKKQESKYSGCLFSEQNLKTLKNYINHKELKKTILKKILNSIKKNELFNDIVKEEFSKIIIYLHFFQEDRDNYYLVDGQIYHAYISLKNSFNIQDEDENAIVEYVNIKNTLKGF